MIANLDHLYVVTVEDNVIVYCDNGSMDAKGKTFIAVKDDNGMFCALVGSNYPSIFTFYDNQISSIKKLTDYTQEKNSEKNKEEINKQNFDVVLTLFGQQIESLTLK